MRLLTRSARGLIAGAVLLTSATATAQSGTDPVRPQPTAQSAPAEPSPAPDAGMPSAASLVTDLPGDLRRLPTVANALWLGAAGVLALAVHPADARVTREASGSLPFETVFDSGASLGGGLVQVGGAVGTYLVGRFSHQPGTAIVGADLVRAQIISVSITQAVKLTVNRERPDGLRYSFPSGHSASTFATASVLQRHFGWRVGIPAYAAAAYVATSRLSENKHYLSDVIFGAGIGIVSGRAVTVGRGAQTFAVGPLVTRGGVGVSFTRVSSR